MSPIPIVYYASGADLGRLEMSSCEPHKPGDLIPSAAVFWMMVAYPYKPLILSRPDKGNYVDLRYWWWDGTKLWRTRHGIWIPLDKIEPVIRGLESIQHFAQEGHRSEIRGHAVSLYPNLKDTSISLWIYSPRALGIEQRCISILVGEDNSEGTQLWSFDEFPLPLSETPHLIKALRKSIRSGLGDQSAATRRHPLPYQTNSIGPCI